MDSVNKYLEQYESIKRVINDISSILKNPYKISDMDVTDAIKEIANIFATKMLPYKLYGLSDEQVKSIKEKNKEIKQALIDLKNEQIYAYNLKVWEINDKLEKMKNAFLSTTGGDKTQGLNPLKWCNVHIYGDWKKANYSRYLDYDKLVEMFNKVSELERKIIVYENEPIDLRIKIDFCLQTLEDIKNKINTELSLDDINNLLDKCIFMYSNIIDMDILFRKYIADGLIDDKYVSKYNYSITTVYDNLNKLKNKLMSKKKELEFKSNDFLTLKNKLEILSKESRILQRKIFEHYGKMDKLTLDRFRGYLTRLKNNLDKLEKEKLNITGKLEHSQVEKLDLDIRNLRHIYEDIDNKIKGLKNPYMMGDKYKEYVNDKINKLEENLNGLEERIKEYLELSLKDKIKNKDINLLINDRKLDIEHIEILLLDVDSNKELKERLKNIKNKFNNICTIYNSKKPLLVKKVRSTDNLYKKYKKECLQISGLSSVSLLQCSPLIPAIMHGNMVIGAKVPILGEFINSVNTILGNIINARRNEQGEWFLSNGFKIGPDVVETSLLQNVASSGITNLPIIRNIINSIKKIKLKMNGANKKVKGIFEDLKEKGFDIFNHKKSQNEQNKLVNDFYNSGINDIDEYCVKYNLTDVEKQVLKSSIAYENERRSRKSH